jgi:hypothetical protein
MPDPSTNDELDLETFLEMLPHLGRQELLAISATHGEIDAEAREAARGRVAEAARKRGVMDELDRLQGSILQWASADLAQSSKFTMANANDPVLTDLRMQAVPALVGIAAGLLLGDSLDAGEREVLLRPMRTAGD